MSVPTSKFLSIPPEIRILIYEKLAGDNHLAINFVYDGSIRSRTFGSPEILQVNKQVRSEAQWTLRVRNARIYVCDRAYVEQYSRIPRIVSRWVDSIENLVVAYSPEEFSKIVEYGGQTKHTWILSRLSNIVVHLPKVHSFVIRCQGILGNWNGNVSATRIATFAEGLLALLPSFNRTQVITGGRRIKSGSSELDVEIEISKVVPDTQGRPLVAYRNEVRTPKLRLPPSNQEKNALKGPSSTKRHVFLDVMTNPDHPAEYELTTNEVNQ